MNNAETAEIINRHAADDGLVILGPLFGGCGCRISTVPIVDFPAGMSKYKCGTIVNADAWNAIGINTVATSPMDLYESLSRGVYEYAGFALSNYVPMSLYEVAPYLMNSNDFGTSMTIMIRDEIWAKLTEETQQVFKDAAAFAREQNKAANEKAIEDIQGVAKEYTVMDPQYAEEVQKFIDLGNHGQMIGFAQTRDGDAGVQDMITLINYKSQLQGYETLPEEYR